MQHLATLLDVLGTHDGFGNDRDTIYDVLDDLGSLERVSTSLRHQEVGLESYEVHLMGSDILLELRGVVLAGKAVGVFTVGQEHHLDVHALLE